MTTKRLEDQSLEALITHKKKVLKSQKQVLVLMIVLLIMIILVAIWRVQQGIKFSNSIPFIMIPLVCMTAQRGHFQKKIKNIDTEIQKRS